MSSLLFQSAGQRMRLGGPSEAQLICSGHLRAPSRSSSMLQTGRTGARRQTGTLLLRHIPPVMSALRQGHIVSQLPATEHVYTNIKMSLTVDGFYQQHDEMLSSCQRAEAA